MTNDFNNNDFQVPVVQPTLASYGQTQQSNRDIIKCQGTGQFNSL